MFLVDDEREKQQSPLPGGLGRVREGGEDRGHWRPSARGQEHQQVSLLSGKCDQRPHGEEEGTCAIQRQQTNSYSTGDQPPSHQVFHYILVAFFHSQPDYSINFLTSLSELSVKYSFKIRKKFVNFYFSI